MADPYGDPGTGARGAPPPVTHPPVTPGSVEATLTSLGYTKISGSGPTAIWEYADRNGKPARDLEMNLTALNFGANDPYKTMKPDANAGQVINIGGRAMLWNPATGRYDIDQGPYGSGGGGGGATQNFGFTVSGGRILRTNSVTGAVEDVGAAPQDAQIITNAQGSFIFDPATRQATLIPGTAPQTTTVGGVGGVSPDTAAQVGARMQELDASIANNNAQLQYLTDKARMEESQGKRSDAIQTMGQATQLRQSQASLMADRARTQATLDLQRQAQRQQVVRDIAEASQHAGDFGKLAAMKQAMARGGSGSPISTAVASGETGFTDASVAPLAAMLQNQDELGKPVDLSGYGAAGDVLNAQGGKIDSLYSQIMGSMGQSAIGSPNFYVPPQRAAAPAAPTMPGAAPKFTGTGIDPDTGWALGVTKNAAGGFEYGGVPVTPQGAPLTTGEGLDPETGLAIGVVRDPASPTGFSYNGKPTTYSGALAGAAMGTPDTKYGKMMGMMGTPPKAAIVGDSGDGSPTGYEEVARAVEGPDGEPALSVDPLHPEQRMAEMAGGGGRMQTFMKLLSFLADDGEEEMPHAAFGVGDWLQRAQAFLSNSGRQALAATPYGAYPTPILSSTPGTMPWEQQLQAGITAVGKGIDPEAYLQEAAAVRPKGIMAQMMQRTA